MTIDHRSTKPSAASNGRASWEKPAFRRIEAENAEGTTGFAAVDGGTFS